MVKNVKFLPPNTAIKNVGNKLIIVQDDDPVEKLLGKREEKSADVLEMIIEATRTWSEKQQKVILPLSGGYDSRLLSFALRNNDKVNSYTYGISQHQEDSFEVYNAKQVADINRIKWKQIELGDFHKFCDEWFENYGPSVHLHGMYQMEFYNKIKLETYNGSVLSGIVGDAWAGGVNLPEINNGFELSKLGYTHGLNIDNKYCKLKDTGYLKEKF